MASVENTDFASPLPQSFGGERVPTSEESKHPKLQLGFIA